MKKKIIVIILLTIGLSMYSSIKNIQNTSEYAEYTEGDESEYALKAMIYNRTIDDLKKHGIEKFLLYNNGYWFRYPNQFLLLKKNGILLVNHAGRALVKLRWKVVNNNLYINPFSKYHTNKNLNKFFLTKVKPVREFSYAMDPENLYIKRIQYVIELRSIEKVKDRNSGRLFNAVGFDLKTYKIGTEGSNPPYGVFPED